MICPFCKEEIAEGAIKCKHCGSMLSTQFQTQTQVAAQTVIPDSTNGHAVIDALPISEGLKKKLHFVHDNLKGIKFGCPYYGKISFSENLSQFNIFAFLFTVFYYLVKGMWRKALVLLLIHIVLQVLVTLILPWQYQGLGSLLCVMAIASIAASSAYCDLYRKYVLKQEFWW